MVTGTSHSLIHCHALDMPERFEPRAEKEPRIIHASEDNVFMYIEHMAIAATSELDDQLKKHGVELSDEAMGQLDRAISRAILERGCFHFNIPLAPPYDQRERGPSANTAE